MTTVTNTDSRHVAKIFRGTGKAIEFVRDLAPLSSCTFDDDGFYWADTGRVSFDEIDAAVARAWARYQAEAQKPSIGAQMFRKALEAA